ncbi:hypothetical protein [Pseudaestuariivita atlantica]|uniref:Ig-like domain-containing protein n=1 Tax=Pseudaestuariivita atlantica TaxID=1317121 RepID=A0A0L1JUB5_9RHOB|nr:hypothetical protein [Pseudaestuariivita atlantica]KNG95356.1 hypothetical protein ATO11_01655 [Pseudaestuariivita atlantica]
MTHRFPAACLSAAILGIASPLAAPALAQVATAYTCTIQKKQDIDLVPEILFIGHRSGDKTAIVSDPIVLHFNDDQPMEAKAVRVNSEKAVFRWTVRGPRTTDHRTVRLRYEVDINRKTGAIFLAARVTELRGQLSGRGTCEIKQIKTDS